ncbi:LysM peptidoglycan-binding domain-containing protein, partial [Accumulibacter sp.]|uniref:LysM peptidoglycan-binding domain-containing protein n=1 Tax=Accumulibacter sp. TaxID=2053492 RepID=UPI002C31F1B2
MHSKIQVAAAALILAGCATAPPPQPATPQPTPSDSARSDAPPAPPPTPRPPPSVAEQQQANKTALRVADLLEAGNEVDARAEIDRALALDPNNKLALNFQRQMTVDPRATLGEESYPYTVKPGESLSKIAGRFLGDIYGFYLLARYNDIKVPRLVSAGQTIRVPGKAPPPEARPPREARPVEPKP